MDKEHHRDLTTSSSRWLHPHLLGVRVLWYLGAAGVSLAILIIGQRLEFSSLDIPFCFEEDTLYQCIRLKAALDGEQWSHVSRLSAPFGANLHLHPVNAYPDFALACLLTRISDCFGWGLNIAWLTKFALTTIVAMGCFRYLGLSLFASALSSVAFGHLPLFVMYGMGHYNLSSHMVPVAVCLPLAILQSGRAGPSKWQVILLSSVCVLIGISDPYTVLFCLYLLAVVFMVMLPLKRWRQASWAMGAAGLIGLSFVAAAVPFFLASRAYTGNDMTFVANRPAFSFVLEFRHLVFPPKSSLVWSVLRADGDAGTDHLRLGAYGCIGSLIVLAQLCFLIASEKPKGRTAGYLRGACVLTLALFLLCCVGGFNVIISELITTAFRFYSRGIYFIGFFSCFATGVLLDWTLSWLRACRGLGGAKPARIAVMNCVAVLVLVNTHLETRGIQMFARSDAERLGRCREFATFMEAIEETSPNCSTVCMFPAHNEVYNLDNYDHLLPFLFSSRLKWNASPLGQGRFTWGLEEILAADLEELTLGSLTIPAETVLFLAGYDSVLVGGDAYDGGRLETGLLKIGRLEDMSGAVSIRNDELGLKFLDLSEPKALFESQIPDHQRAEARQELIKMLLDD